MADISYEPVKTAYGSIKKLSADEEAQRLAFVRESALHDEISFINEAKCQGREEGRLVGESRLLRKMIQVKFGAIPPWVDDLIRSADSKQIDLWVESLGEFGFGVTSPLEGNPEVLKNIRIHAQTLAVVFNPFYNPNLNYYRCDFSLRPCTDD